MEKVDKQTVEKMNNVDGGISETNGNKNIFLYLRRTLYYVCPFINGSGGGLFFVALPVRRFNQICIHELAFN